MYDKTGTLVGAIGVSGDTSCTDHVIAWKVRHALNFDNVPAGVAAGAPKGTDNIIFDIKPDANGHPVSAHGFGHPACDDAVVGIGNSLPTNFPVGPNP